MSNGTFPTVTSIEMSPMAKSVGRREIGLRSTEVGYDEERADSSASSGFAKMNLPYQPLYGRLLKYFRTKVTPRSLTDDRQQRSPEEAPKKTRLVQRIEDHPAGYPRLAALIGCDMRKFLMCRSFMYSRIRCLLYCQDELAELQQGLLDQDDEDATTPMGRCMLVSRENWQLRNDQVPPKALLLKIAPKLKEYDDLVERTIKFASLRNPDARDVQGVKDWIDDERPLVTEEKLNILNGHDFVALVEKQEEGWLDRVIETALSKFSQSESIFKSPEQRLISDDDYLHLRCRHRIDILIRTVLTISAVSMLLGPSAALYLVVGHNALKLLLIGTFTVLFSAALHTFSKARRHENFAATAGYCAVLVTFLANFSPS